MSNDEMRTAVLNHRLEVFAQAQAEAYESFKEGQTFVFSSDGAQDAHVEAAYRELVAAEAVAAA